MLRRAARRQGTAAAVQQMRRWAGAGRALVILLGFVAGFIILLIYLIMFFLQILEYYEGRSLHLPTEIIR